MKRVAYLILLLLPIAAFANDGAYYASGNHLIPMMEADVSVRKEVLTLTRHGSWIEVNVYYEFYNPAATAKELIVGFEAASGEADVAEYMKAYPNHPQIKNFTVEMNGKKLAYGVSHVAGVAMMSDTMALPYYRKGKIMTVDWKKGMKEYAKDEWGYAPPFDFVYHFKARFEPGVNVVRHTYRYASNGQAGLDYSFEYVLTAANRWANRQIDDFTLKVDMGECETFWVEPLFYTRPDEWTIEGRGRKDRWESWWGDGNIKSVRFHMRQGAAVFSKKNFHPRGELVIESPSSLFFYYLFEPDYHDETISCLREQYTNVCRTFEKYLKEEVEEGDRKKIHKFSPDELRILRNLPFAMRGYRFNNAAVKAFYESTDWYLPDDRYNGDFSSLTREEQFWVNYWKE